MRWPRFTSEVAALSIFNGIESHSQQPCSISTNVDQDVTFSPSLNIPGLKNDYKNDDASDPELQCFRFQNFLGLDDFSSSKAIGKVTRIAEKHD